MHFTITHPMHRHPYNPELVSGDGIAAVAAAAEAAGIPRLRVHRPPGADASAGSKPADTTRWTRSWRWVTPRPAPPRCG